VKENGLNWTVASAGTESYHIGEAPHRYSQKICMAHGIDISDFRASKFLAADFENYDLIYAMAGDVYEEISRIGGRFADMEKVDYFLNELYRSAGSGSGIEVNASVPDPYYGAEEGFLEVYEMINKTCDAIIANYKNKNYV